jgi:hypothetical protein
VFGLERDDVKGGYIGETRIAHKILVSKRKGRAALKTYAQMKEMYKKCILKP